MIDKEISAGIAIRRMQGMTGRFQLRSTSLLTMYNVLLQFNISFKLKKITSGFMVV